MDDKGKVEVRFNLQCHNHQGWLKIFNALAHCDNEIVKKLLKTIVAEYQLNVGEEDKLISETVVIIAEMDKEKPIISPSNYFKNAMRGLEE